MLARRAEECVRSKKRHGNSNSRARRVIIAVSAMKRGTREPFARAGSPNSPVPSPSSAGKRRRLLNSDDGPSSQEPPYGPFQALLAEHGVAWPSAEAMADEDSEKRSLGFSCRSNPSKLRVGVERALVHDGARRSEFVEVNLTT